MSDKNYFKIIFELANKEGLTQADIFEKLTFEERKRLFTNFETANITRKLIEKCNNANIFLFTTDEFYELEEQKHDLLSGGIILPKDIFLRQLENQRYFLINAAQNKNFSLLSIDEKKLIIGKILDKRADSLNYVFIDIFQSLESDEAKEEILSRIIMEKDLKQIFRFEMSHLVKSLSDDRLKQKWLRYVRRNDRSEVIVNFSDDHKKVVHSLSLDRASQEEILLSLKDQDFIKKLALMPMMSKKILMRIKDENVREKYFRRLITMIKNEDKGIIVASFSSREKQLELSQLLHTEISRFELIYSSKVLTDGDKWRIVKKFRSDARIMQVAGAIKDERIRYDLYTRLKDTKAIRDNLGGFIEMESFDLLVNKLSEYELKKVYELYINMPVNYRLKILSKVNDKRWIAKAFETINLTDFSEKDLSHFCDVFAKLYKLNREHLEEFANNFGYGVFKYIKNEKIRTIINQDDDTFKKYMQIFSKVNFISDEKSVKNALFAFSQQEYKFSHPYIINIFSDIVHAIEDKNYIYAEDMIDRIIKESKVSKEEIIKMFSISPEKTRDISKQIVKKLLLKGNESLLEQLHILTNIAIENHRNRSTKDMTTDKFEYIAKGISDKSLMDYFVFAAYPNEVNMRFNRYKLFFSKEEKDFMADDIRLNAVIEFKRNPNNFKMTEQLKKDLRLFGTIIKKINQYESDNDLTAQYYYLANTFPNFEKKVNYDSTRNYEYIFSILQQIDSTQLKETLFNNPEKFNDLLNFLQTSKLLGAANLLAADSEKARVPIDEALIANLINNYAELLKNLEKRGDSKRAGLVDYLVEADYFNSESYRYENLFGREIFRFIKNNPGPNSSPLARKDRIRTATELVKSIYKRKYLPIPPQDRNYTIDNGKTLNVKIGDLNNLNNLVHGERTGACMRIGGAGESLFQFCLLDDNGFHITFNDPESGSFVSRVSGFRNGNTLFLNQLRFSTDDKYSNNDLIACLRQVAKQIIEDTKDSEKPINNVVISPGYAMNHSGDELTNLGVSDIKKGLKKFYSDVDTSAIVLATTAKTGNFAPVTLDEKTPKYEGLKQKPKYYEGRLAAKEIIHLKTLEEFLKGKQLENIDIKDEGALACYVTSTWGIYVNSKNEIKTVTIANKKEILAEMQAALEKFKDMVASSEVINAKSR